MSAPLLFIAADRRELEPWVAKWSDVKPLPLRVHWARSGIWRGREVIALANGVGWKQAAAGIRAAQTICATFSGICSVGTGGALDPRLVLSDIVVASAVTNGSATWAARNPNGANAPSGTVYSAAHIARTSAEKCNLFDTKAILVEMEAAAVAESARALDVPFFCIRVVSDLAHETFFIDFERFLMPDGRFNVPRLVMYAMSHPSKAIPELLRLQRRTSHAANRLAQFLAGCRF